VESANYFSVSKAALIVNIPYHQLKCLFYKLPVYDNIGSEENEIKTGKITLIRKISLPGLIIYF